MGSGHVAQDRIYAASTRWSALFYRDLELAGPGIVGDVCRTLPMIGDVENIDWLGQVPSLVQWIGDRTIESLQDQEYIVRCHEFATGTTIKRKAVDDDKLAQYDGLPSSFAAAAMAHRRQLLADMLLNNPVCYDGQTLFSAAHQDEGEAAQDNDIGGAGTALTPANVLAAISGMGQIYGPKGRVLGISPTHIIYGPANVANAATVFDSQFISDGTTTVTNPTPKAIRPLMLNELGADTAWYAVDLSKGSAMRPSILALREEPVFESQMDPANDAFFMRGEYRIGVRARHNVVPGLWQLIRRYAGTP